MRRTLVQYGWSLLVVASCAAAGGIAVAGDDTQPAADLPPPAKIRDLDYGDVLFHFFQDDYFAALVRLEVAQQAGRVPDHAAEAELLAGGLYLSLGMQREAQRRFEQLLAGRQVPQSVSDRAWFYLARIAFQRGDPAGAWQSLGRIRGTLPEKLEPERRLLAANVLMSLGRFQEAAASLADWQDGSVWADYARFNLGVALVRAGESARGAQLLAAVGTMDARNEERMALRDRANLALGFALLQDRQAEPAAAALRRVRLDGPFTNRALLGLGWAEADSARPQQALAPWLELRERPVVDAAVQESFLAVPYAYTRLAANGQAAEQYRNAVSAYAAESRRIDESIAAIRSGGFLDSVLDAMPQGVGGPEVASWFWQLSSAPDAPHTRYLYPLLASHAFQEGLKDYRDLRIMQANLTTWSGSLEAFGAMVEAREAAARTVGPRKAQVVDAADLAASGQRRDELEARVAKITATRDIAALATAEEAAQWRELDALDARIATLPAGEKRDALAERARLQRGTLAWQLDAGYKLRLSRLRTGLREVDAELTEARGRFAAVEQASGDAPRSTGDFAARVSELDARIAGLKPRIDATAAAQEHVLADIAVRELEAQKARLASYATQAQFALAALYDGAASEGAQ
jgi:hypothetical protein